MSACNQEYMYSWPSAIIKIIEVLSRRIFSYYVSSERNTTHTYLTHPTGPFLIHKATTYGGSAGAPLFKVVQGEPVVVALHCGYVPPTGPPQLNGSFLISHILHHALNGSFKEGRLLKCSTQWIWSCFTFSSLVVCVNNPNCTMLIGWHMWLVTLSLPASLCRSTIIGEAVERMYRCHN